MRPFRIATLRLQPGDALVVTCDQALSPTQHASIKDMVRSGLGAALDPSISILVLDRGVHLSQVCERRSPAGFFEAVARFISSWFAWRDMRSTGVWIYQENTVTGRRRATRSSTTGYQPLAQAWLLGGEFGEYGPPPFGGSAVRKAA